MPKFHYKAIRTDGVMTSGEIDAVDAAHATEQLESAGLRVESIESIGETPERGDALPEWGIYVRYLC